MLINILKQHKLELEVLQSKFYFERTFPQNIDELLSSVLIKLITGPRRAGKSVFSLLLLKTRSFAYVNFDDDSLLKTYSYDALIQAVHQVYPDFQYLFLDEIQNLPEWELTVNKPHRRGYNIILTGSNARLLSREMGSSLTGRYMPIELLPFSFKEYFNAITPGYVPFQTALPEPAGKEMAILDQYLTEGGYPESISNRTISHGYLSILFDSVILKDVVKRFNIRHAQQIYDLANYFLNNYTNPFTFSGIRQLLEFNSVATVQKFAGYLEEPYLFFFLPRFSNKLKEQQKAARKVYVVDNGFIRSRSRELSPNRGRLLENMVFIELIRRGYRQGIDLFYYKTRNNREVDFLCRRDGVTESIIQVCYDISEPKTKDREVTSLIEANNELHAKEMILLTWQTEESMSKNGFQIMPVGKWLMTA